MGDPAARHDIILFGATGFTGGLVAEYLARTRTPGQGSWALAGRDPRKLRAVRERLARIDPAWAELPLYQGLAHDPESLHDLAARTRVMLTTVGPYAGQGEALVAACVAEGCDYVDLTGEPAFWQGVIERHHDEAAAKKLRLVPCCGFDSIPHDLGALWAAQQLPGDEPIEIDGYVAARGGMSGGTWASLLRAMSQLGRGRGSGSGRSRSGDSPGGGSGRRPTIHFASEVGRWAVPMPSIDPLVVKRTAALTGAHGRSLRYRHYFTMKSLPGLLGLVGGLGAVLVLSKTPLRHAMERMRPSGSGPSEAQRERGWFRVTFVARRGDRSVVAEVRGGDPGYGHTAKMIAEAARCLAEDRDALPARYGVLTPAAAMGDHLIERLRTTGMEFTVRASS